MATAAQCVRVRKHLLVVAPAHQGSVRWDWGRRRGGLFSDGMSTARVVPPPGKYGA